MTDAAIYERGSCSALVITCSDFRFKSAEREFLDAAGLTDDYDLIARPGAIRSLVEPRSEAARESMLQEIEILVALHGSMRFLLANHMRCGAYRALTTPEGERDLHRRHLAAAAAALGQAYPKATIEAYLITVDARGATFEPISGS